mgnify:CR=1 FL=1
MRKVLIITGVFPPEPVTSANMNFDLAMALSEKYEVTVVHPKPTRPEGVVYKPNEENYPFKCITVDSYTYPKSSPIGRMRESISFGRISAQFLKGHHYDFDFVYNDGWQLFGLYIVAKVCTKYKIPYIVPIQDIYPECFFTNRKVPAIMSGMVNALIKPIDRYYQKNAYKVRTISDEMADYLSSTRQIDRDRYLVTDNWQNDEDFTAEPIPSGKLIFGYVGSINNHSNTELLIKAFDKAALKDAELRIFGMGNRRERCEELAKSMGNDNIVFDSVAKSEVPKVQSQCSVLVLALPKGNGGLCLPSKMSSYLLSGRPVIASIDKDSATCRYINESGAGFCIEPDDIDALANTFKNISMMSKEELQQMGDKSRKFADLRLTRKANLTKLCNEINKIIQ